MADANRSSGELSADRCDQRASASIRRLQDSRRLAGRAPRKSLQVMDGDCSVLAESNGNIPAAVSRIASSRGTEAP